MDHTTRTTASGVKIHAATEDNKTHVWASVDVSPIIKKAAFYREMEQQGNFHKDFMGKGLIPLPVDMEIDKQLAAQGIDTKTPGGSNYKEKIRDKWLEANPAFKCTNRKLI